MVVAAVVVLLGGFAVFQLVGGNDSGDGPTVVEGPTTPPPVEPVDGPTDPPSAPPVVPDPPPRDPPLNVESLVVDPVGKWSLVAAAEVPEFITQLGASSAVRLQYEDPTGLNVRHILSAFSDATAADDSTQLFVDDIVRVFGAERLDEFPVEVEGRQVGTAYVLAHEGGHIVVFNNGPLLISTAAAALDSIGDFLSNVPY